MKELSITEYTLLHSLVADRIELLRLLHGKNSTTSELESMERMKGKLEEIILCSL